MSDESEMEMESDDGFEEDAVVVGQMPTVSVPKHIKKRSLKNKALNVGFNDKELRDFVTGFHKRKKKRRKEAQRQIEEKERKKRIEARKKRKQEREFALYGRVLSSEDNEGDGSEPNAGNLEADESYNAASVAETKTYQDGNTTITVTTCELSNEHDDIKQLQITKPSSLPEKSRPLAVKKKPMKQVSRRKSKKGGRRSGFKKNKKDEGGKKAAAQKDNKRGRKGRR